jgi:hypothetical protein
MKKWLIGALVGAIILFAWQGTSWMVLQLHNDATKYHPAQDSIMSYLSTQFKEEGSYMLPTVKAGATTAEREECMKKALGHPWAMIVYHPTMNDDMTRSFIRGFLVDFFLLICFIYMISRGGWPIPRRIFAASVTMGLFVFLIGPYTSHIFMSTPLSAIKADLIDYMVAWTLCGAWLAWWLGKKANS